MFFTLSPLVSKTLRDIKKYQLLQGFELSPDMTLLSLRPLEKS